MNKLPVTRDNPAMDTLQTVLSFVFHPVLVLKNHPVLFKYKDVYIVTAGLINSVAAVLSLVCALYFYKALFPVETADGSWVWKLAMVPFFSLFFSKAFHVVALGREFLRNPKKYLGETAFYNQGGQFGVLFGTIWFSVVTGINFLACMDINLLGGCLALTLGRVGCYSYGCCHGRRTSSRFAVVYTHPQTKVLRVFPELANVPLVPTQLISAAYNFLLFLAMLWALSLSPKAGMVSAFFILAYNGFRIFIERYRLSVINVSTKKIWMQFYMRVAALFAGFGGVYLLFVLWTQAPRLSFAAPLTPGEYFRWMASQPQTVAVLVITFAVYMLTWGMHYKKMGQHFQWHRV